MEKRSTASPNLFPHLLSHSILIGDQNLNLLGFFTTSVHEEGLPIASLSLAETLADLDIDEGDAIWIDEAQLKLSTTREKFYFFDGYLISSREVARLWFFSRDRVRFVFFE